jgi:hypothetical protein
MYNNIHRLLVTALVLLIFQTFPASSQGTSDLYKPDVRLYDCMSKAHVDQLSSDKSDLIPYYNYYLEHSFYVASLNAEKPVTGTDIHKVLSTESKTVPGKTFSEKVYVQGKFNPLKYNFTRAIDGFTTYVWKEAGIALVFYPERQFQALFDDYLKKQKAQ